MTHYAKLLLCLLLAVTLAGCESETYERPIGPGDWILVDLYHTRLQNPSDHRLYKWNYAYQGVHGYSRLFDHLKTNGYPWSGIREMRLSDERLEGFKVLFVNLLHDQRPDFTDEERQAIDRFVKNGGGLVMIVDHTNVYRHAERANRILKPMGIEALYHSALDYPPNTVSGTGWIAITNFTDHPINEGVDMISFQTGGPVKSDGGTSFLSDRGFADFWDETETGGFYGNWKHDGDDTKEPRGSSVAVVAAVEYGKGRVAVIGDQNIYGDAWLHFGNNFEHATNIFEWAAGNNGTDKPLRNIRPVGHNIAHDINFTEYNPGQSGQEDYYAMFVNWNRDTTVTGRGVLKPDYLVHDTYVLTSPTKTPTEEEIQSIKKFFEQGKRVVLSFEFDRLSSIPSTIDFIQALAPDLTVEVNGTIIDFSKSKQEVLQTLQNLQVERLDKTFNLFSPDMVVDDLVVAAYTQTKKGDEVTFNPYMLNIQSDWGDSFLRVKGNQRVDIARKKRIDRGELIVFIQDGFWKNRTLGSKETSPPTSEGVDPVRLQYSFIDYLKTPVNP